MMKWILSIALVLGSLTLSATDGYRQLGYGVKSKGMGGVGVALPQDSLVVAMNPAGMMRVANRFDVGLHWMRPRGSLRVRDMMADTDNKYRSVDDFYWPEVGIAWNFCPCQTLGVAFYGVGGFKTRYTVPIPELEPPENASMIEKTPVKTRFDAYTLSPSWAWQINRCNSVGVAVNVSFAWLQLDGLEGYDDPLVSASPGYVTNNEIDNAQGVSVRVGWLGEPCRNLLVGVSYQTRTWMNDFKKYRGFIADFGCFNLPGQWAFGASYKWRCIVVSAEADRLCYTDSRMFKHDQMRTGLYGSEDGPGFGWKDIWVFKGGAAVTLFGCATIRAGWSYGDMLYAGREVLINAVTLTTVQHHWTVGGTVKWGCFEFSANYVHGIGHPITDHDQEDKYTRVRSKSDSIGISLGRRF